MKRLNLPKEKLFVGPALLWKRIVAFLVDMAILLFIVLYPFLNYIENSVKTDSSFGETLKLISANSKFTAISFAMWLLVFLYFFLLEKKMSQTIGKKLLNIYVVTDDNKNLGAWKSLLRNIELIPIFPFFILMVADPLFMLFNKTNQRLSEIISKTKVVAIYDLEQNL